MPDPKTPRTGPSAGERHSDSHGQDGTFGFAGHLGGHSKVTHAHTSSFDVKKPEHHLSGFFAAQTEETGCEESGRMRHPATSTAGRIIKSE